MTSLTHKRKKLIILVIVLPFILFTSSLVSNFLSMFLEPLTLTNVSTPTSRSENSAINVYIPGAGFSGFFYTLGRLQALHKSTNYISSSYQYYCFSAGCLALLTSLMHVPVDFALELAHTSRNRWITGEISRYDVVEYFVDGLFSFGVENKNCTNSTRESEIENAQFTSETVSMDIRKYFPSINVITSAWDARHRITQRIQQPLSVEHFKELLIQTTWIPFVTGVSLWKREGDIYHSDGAFAGLLQSFNPSFSEHEQLFLPSQYHHSLLLPWNFDMLRNGLNIQLGHDEAIRYWEEGYKRGVLAS